MLPTELEVHIGGPAGFLGPVGIAEVMTQGSLNGLNSGKELAKLKGVLRENPSEGLKSIVVMDLGTGRPEKSSCRREQAGLPLPQRHTEPRLYADPDRGHSQHQ